MAKNTILTLTILVVITTIIGYLYQYHTGNGNHDGGGCDDIDE